jgi:hypothetical protein
VQPLASECPIRGDHPFNASTGNPARFDIVGGGRHKREGGELAPQPFTKQLCVRDVWTSPHAAPPVPYSSNQGVASTPRRARVVMANGLSIRMGRPPKIALGQKYADYRRMIERTARRSTCRRKLSARSCPGQMLAEVYQLACGSTTCTLPPMSRQRRQKASLVPSLSVLSLSATVLFGPRVRGDVSVTATPSPPCLSAQRPFSGLSGNL